MSSHSLSVSLRLLLRNSAGVADLAAEKATLIPSDDELMALIKHGDHDAFAWLSDRYLITVRRIALRIDNGGQQRVARPREHVRNARFEVLALRRFIQEA
jgi:hypothetical protein